MGSEWREVSLGDVCKIRRGSSPRPIVDFLSETEGMPWVKIADATESNSRFIEKTNQFIKEEGVCKSVIVEKGDLILSNSGTAGLPKFMSMTGCIHDGWQVLKDLDGITSNYLYYTLLYIRLLLLHNAYDSTMKNLTLDMVRDAKIQLPPLPEQKAIAHFLGTLDDKIELNRRMNATLEGMAQALFKSWFVDFDPVIDNALAAGNPIPDELAPRAEVRRQALANGTANRDLSAVALAKEEAAKPFPAAFQQTETMGWIPEGWEVMQLDELIKLIGGGTPKTSVEAYWNGEIPWFSVVDAPNDSDVFVIDTEKRISKEGLNNSSTKLLRPGTTIISARGTVGKCALVGTDMTMNQSCYGIQGADGASDSYTYYSIRHYVSDLQQRGHGSVFNTITRDTFRSIKVPFGGAKLTCAFEAQVRDQLARVKANLKEQTTLTKLRDTLLPKLISGELRITEAEQLTEEALT